MRALLAALLLLGLAQAPATAAPTPDVLVIGDSMTVTASPFLKDKRPDWRIDAKWGRGVTQLPVQLAKHRAPDVLVIALGTNAEEGWWYRHYFEVIHSLPERTQVVLVTPYSAAPNYRLDNVYTRWMRNLSAGNSKVALANWHRAAKADPTLLADGLHQSPKGVKVWSRLIFDAVSRVHG